MKRNEAAALVLLVLMVLALVVMGRSEELVLPSQAPPSVMAAQEEDPHANQPDHCSNAKNAPPAHRCDCHKAEPEDGGMGCDVEDVKCRVYCRKDHCHCFHPKCDS